MNNQFMNGFIYKIKSVGHFLCLIEPHEVAVDS